MHGLKRDGRVLWEEMHWSRFSIPPQQLLAPPSERAYFFDKFSRSHRQDYFAAKYRIFESLRHAQLKIARITHTKKRGILLLLASFSFCFLMGRPPTIEWQTRKLHQACTVA
jgi:hypothetical protein